MTSFATQPATNPLSKHFRQPILYIKLPSNGNWYPQGVLNLPVTGEIPVYAMTARDEITMRTPDALLNGASTVQVIQSCCPNITDPWKMPIVDLDTILLSIRLASYGKELEFVAVCPHCSTKNEKALDVSVMLDKINVGDWRTPVAVDDLQIYLKPLNYEQANENNFRNFNEQRMLNVISDDTLSDDEKTSKFNELFQKLIETGINAVTHNISRIVLADGTVVDNYAFIREFMDNCDRSVFDAIKAHLDKFRELNTYNKVDLTCENQECQKEFTTPFLFEQTNFFE